MGSFDFIVNMSAGVIIAVTIIGTIMSALSIVGNIRAFQKAGLPGWGFLIPFYSIMLWAKLAGFKSYYGLLVLVPVVGLVLAFVISYKALVNFGFSGGLVIASFFFVPITFYMYAKIAFSPNCQFIGELG